MKKFILLFIFTGGSLLLQAQVDYDSITVSRCSFENEYLQQGSNWPVKLKTGEFSKFISGERIAWKKPAGNGKQTKPAVLLLADRIKNNGTEDVAKCFIPRHSINFYKGGVITRCLLVCFECDGLHFSDDPKNLFIKNIDTRDKQMLELKKLFKELL